MSDSDVFSQYITGLSLGPLTTTFTPGGAGCATIILQVGDEEPGNGRTAQWASLKYRPIDLTSCYPDAWTWHFPHSTYFHSPGVCPSGMTYACMGTTTPGPEEQVVSTAFCCPRYVVAIPFPRVSVHVRNIERFVRCSSCVAETSLSYVAAILAAKKGVPIATRPFRPQVPCQPTRS